MRALSVEYHMPTATPPAIQLFVSLASMMVYRLLLAENNR